MPTYVMLTRLSHESCATPGELEPLEKRVVHLLKEECPSVRWLTSYSVLGPYDYLDIFEAPDNEVATTVATIMRTFGHAQTEIWPATSWARFKHLLHKIPPNQAEA